MYPIAMNHAGRVLPRRILTVSIGWIAGFGQAGSAVLPFMTGAISSKYGIKSLQPLWVFTLSFLDYLSTSYISIIQHSSLVVMMGVMVIMWAIVPGHQHPDYTQITQIE